MRKKYGLLPISCLLLGCFGACNDSAQPNKNTDKQPSATHDTLLQQHINRHLYSACDTLRDLGLIRYKDLLPYQNVYQDMNTKNIYCSIYI